MSDLTKIRQELNAIDQEIIQLLNRRAELSLEVGKIKDKEDDIIFKPFREREILNRLVAQNPGPLPKEHLIAIYREILSSSRRLQRPQDVLFLGPEGTFCHLAGLEYLGQSVNFIPKRNIEGVFQGVIDGEGELGIIPLENSLQGSVGQSLDLFLRYNVFIHAELYYRITHTLVSIEQDIDKINIIYSHPIALEQCGAWLKLNLPKATLIPVESTAEAARRAKITPQTAAIGNRKLANIFSLNVLATHIEDLPDNWTRFLIISAHPSEKEGKEKTSILFILADQPGALSRVLQIFAEAKINLKKLESRPLPEEKWRYVFFADLECDLNKKEYQSLIAELKKNCYLLKVLGSYPKGDHLNARI